MNHVRGLVLCLMLAAAVLATASACGGGDNDGGDQRGSPVATADDGDGAASSEIALVQKDTLFDKTELKAKAGSVTFTVDNQDGGVVHNLHIYKGTDDSGEDIGETELEAGPITQTLTVTLEPGTYFFVCDSHPATMAGTIEVE